MLLLDERIGSRDMRSALERQGLQVDLARLDACDIAFVGRGIDDEPISVGIELKRLKVKDGRSDLIQSLRTGRLAGSQLGGMQEYDRVWLITEGIWRTRDDGAMEVWQHGSGWRAMFNGRSSLQMGDVEAQILSLIIRGGVNYWHCPKPSDTIRFVVRLYKWWTDKSLDEHRSHQAIYLPPPDRAVFIEPNTFTKMVSCIPGIGYDKALALNAYFGGSLDRLYAATVKEIRAVEGIGAKLAERLYSVLHS